MKTSSSLSLAVLLLPALLPLQGGPPASRPAGRPPSLQKGRGRAAGKPPRFPGLPPGKAGPRRRRASPLVGTWEIRKACFPGAPPGLQVRGYAVFTPKYASFQVFLREPRAEPLFQSGFWRYAYMGGRIRFQSLLGVRAAPGGRLLPDKKGSIHERIPRFLGGGVLRLYRGRGAYMEMIRLE